KIWNYSKTPSRGVSEMEIYADDLLIYKGFLKKAPSKDEKRDFYQSILFTNDLNVIEMEKNHIYTSTAQHVVFCDNEMRMERVTAMKDLVRPMTSVSHKK